MRQHRPPRPWYAKPLDWSAHTWVVIAFVLFMAGFGIASTLNQLTWAAWFVFAACGMMALNVVLYERENK